MTSSSSESAHRGARHSKRRRIRRLYVQVYLANVLVLVLFGCLVGVTWWLFGDDLRDERRLRGVAETLGELLPGPERPAAELEETLNRLRERFDVDLAVRTPTGGLVASAGPAPPMPERGRDDGGVRFQRRGGWAVTLRLPDGRWLSARHGHRDGHEHDHRYGPRWLGVLFLLGIAIAVGAYPLARRITRRLERLRGGVEELGSGDLSARVRIEGADEVADLARSFNRAADRIEQLVDAQRAMLAAASHELRSPLARIRMAVELLATDGRRELREQAARDIAELDELIEELLLASRLETLTDLEHVDTVDLLAMTAEEGARVGADVRGRSCTLPGDGRLLRRLLRNLFENAQRYAGDTSIEATVETADDGGVMLSVCDRGPGVAEEHRERIFDPFFRPPGMAEGEGGGVGLGLALVREIARRHGGDVRCISRPGGGSCFEVRLAGAGQTRRPA